MATLVKTPSGTWKAIVRKTGWPQVIKTVRTKRDGEDWARRVEDEMVREVYIDRAPSERMTLKAALTRYLSEVTPAKKPSTQYAEQRKAKAIFERLGAYSLAAITPDIVAHYRDERLAEGKGNPTPRCAWNSPSLATCSIQRSASGDWVLRLMGAASFAVANRSE